MSSGQGIPLRLAGNLLMLFFGVFAVYQFRIGGRTGNPPAMIFSLLLAAASATAAGLFFVHLHLPSIAERVAFGWLYPRRHLKRAPVMLSPVQGLIAAGRFQEAEQQLTALMRNNPDRAEIALLLMNLYADRLHQPESAAAVAETYLTSGAVRKDFLHCRILLRYADLLQDSDRRDQLAARLENELKHGRLTAPETLSIRKRLRSLQTHQS